MPKKKLKPWRRWLLLNRGCEVSVYSGPWLTQVKFGAAVVTAIKTERDLYGDGDASLHILTLDEKYKTVFPEITDFSGAFMDAARCIADGHYSDEDWKMVMAEED